METRPRGDARSPRPQTPLPAMRCLRCRGAQPHLTVQRTERGD